MRRHGAISLTSNFSWVDVFKSDLQPLQRFILPPAGGRRRLLKMGLETAKEVRKRGRAVSIQLKLGVNERALCVKPKITSALVLFLFFLCVLNGLPAAGQTFSADEYRVKAAFLYNLARFVDWPPGKFQETIPPSSLVSLENRTSRK